MIGRANRREFLESNVEKSDFKISTNFWSYDFGGTLFANLMIETRTQIHRVRVAVKSVITSFKQFFQRNKVSKKVLSYEIVYLRSPRYN